MAHIECFKNNGIEYLRICEGRYSQMEGKQKKIILKNLGPLSRFDDGQPDFLARIREQFRAGEVSLAGVVYRNDNFPQNNIVNIKFDTSSDVDCFGTPKNIGYFFLEGIYNELGIFEVLNRIKSDSKIQYDLNGITKLLVFNRILHPCSKKMAYEQRDEYLFPVVHTDDINEVYRALDVLDAKNTAIQMRMNTRIKQSSIGRKSDLTYYDVTNYYFETMYGDEDGYLTDEEGVQICTEDGRPIISKKALRKKGVSKENRKEPIVQMGLFIDQNGLPVSYNLYPGNMQDGNTFTDMIRNSISKSGLGKVVVVADNGMNNQENICLLKQQGNGYIVSKSVKKCWKSYKDWILDESGYEERKNTNNEIVFKQKSRIIHRTVRTKSGESLEIEEKEIVYWSRNHYEREVAQNRKFIEYLNSCKEHPDKLKDKQRKSQEFIKVIQTDAKTGKIVKTKAVVVLLEEKIEKYQQTMGYYMIITSETTEDNHAVIDRYHGLSRIEDSFRIIKRDLEGRPVYVRINEHINAHFLICFIALTIIRLLQYKILRAEGKPPIDTDGWEEGITAEKLKDALNGLQADALPQGYYRLNHVDQTDAQRLADMAGVDIRLRLPTESDIRKLRLDILKRSVI